ncbi:MAG: hypothetical protein M3R38_00990 [Actinomycetota bacterium]|nr:hypothetical protein [Actinomycetota bacterium]
MSELTFGKRLALFLDRYRKPDGSNWTPKEIEAATNGFVTASYLSNLKADRIRQPGYDRLKSIATAMRFPPALWYEPSESWEEAEHRHRRRQPSLARALTVLMQTSLNDRTGKPFTAEDVARLSGGRLTPDQVRGLQTGELTDPAMSQLVALSEVFGVEPGFWYSPSKDLMTLDGETFNALRNEKTHLILSKIHGRPDAEKDMILRTIEHLDTMRDLYSAADTSEER